MAYVKLFGSILASTIWSEPNATRILWITMLAMADRDGLVEGSIPGLATMARLSLDEVSKALIALASPDPYSRTQDHEGRRIQECRGGWVVLNYEYYRDRQDAADTREKDRLRQQRKRDRDKLLESRPSRSSDEVTRNPTSGSSDLISASNEEEEDARARSLPDAAARLLGKFKTNRK